MHRWGISGAGSSPYRGLPAFRAGRSGAAFAEAVGANVVCPANSKTPSCRRRCEYCIFRQVPGKFIRRHAPRKPLMNRRQFVHLAAGAAALPAVRTHRHGPGLAGAVDPRVRHRGGGERGRRRASRRVRSARDPARAADRGREPRRRGRNDRGHHGRESPSRRLHDPGCLLGAHRRAMAPSESALRYVAGPRCDRRSRHHTERAGHLAVERIENHSTVHCRGKGQARIVQLRLDRRWYRDPHERGTLPRQCGHRSGSRSRPKAAPKR